MLVDSHCHLNDETLKKELPGVLERAKENDISTILTVCTTLSEFPELLSIANHNQNVFCTIGVHPCKVSEDTLMSSGQIVELCKKEPKVIGIGETGLDYHYEQDSKELQKQSFIQHIEAAQATQLPLIVHTRDADEDTVAILEEMYSKQPFKGVIHCFTASDWLAHKCVALGMYISASGILTFKNATQIQNTFKTLPLDKILVETDAPYLAPIPYRGKKNEPSYVKHTAEFLASLLIMDFQDLASQTTKNFFTLFDKARQAI